MLKVVYSGPVDVCYGQIYAVSPNCEPILLEDAFRGQSNGLCGAHVRGGLMLLCGLHSGKVNLEVLSLDSPPPDEPSWTEVVEAPFKYLAAPVTLEDWNGRRICTLPIDGPGHMVRWCARRFGEAEDLDGSKDDEPYEEYAMYIWRSSAPVERIVKQTSERASCWHQQARDTR